MVLVTLWAAPGGPRAPEVWNLSGIQFIRLSTASVPNFSFLNFSLQKCEFYGLGVVLVPLGTAPGGAQSPYAMESLQHTNQKPFNSLHAKFYRPILKNEDFEA